MLFFLEQTTFSAVILDITKGDFGTLLSTYYVSFSMIVRGGANGRYGSEEIQVSKNTEILDLGCSSTTTVGDLPSYGGVRWVNPTSNVEISLDNSNHVSSLLVVHSHAFAGRDKNHSNTMPQKSVVFFLNN